MLKHNEGGVGMRFYDWLVEQNTLETAIRLIMAMFAGMMMGLDRGMKRRGAGVKTYSLVCLGAAIVMLTGEYIYNNYEGAMDVSRLGAQVISGVGFLGVGTIIVTGRNQVRGLTTAAGLWTCACIGLAIGIGFYDGATIMIFLCIFVLKVMTRVDNYVYKRSKVLDLYISFYSIKQIAPFMEAIKKIGIKILYFEVRESKGKGAGNAALITVEIPPKMLREEAMEKLNKIDGISYVEEL